jgi:hypothetical protein
MGGEGSSGTLGSVEVAPLADGGLGSFGPGAPLAVARSFAASVALGSGVYLFGGESGGQPLDGIEHGDGVAFSSLSTGLRAPRSRAGVVLAGNFVHLVGGRGPAGALADEERLAFDAGAAPKGFTANVLLDQVRANPAIVTLCRWLYLLGGRASLTPGSPPLDAVARVEVAPDGELLGPFSKQPPLHAARYVACVAVIDQTLYVIGGSAQRAPEPTIEKAAIGDDGDLGPFTPTSLVLNTPRSGHQCVVLGRYLYVLGGFGLSDDVTSIERAEITGPGTLGPFSTVSPHLQTARRGFAIVANGQSLFVAGGVRGTQQATLALDGLERADYDADGELHDLMSASGLLEAREAPSSVVVGGAWTVVGGAKPGSSLATLEAAPFSADGTLGSFSLSSSQLMTGRNALVALALGDVIYALGGFHETTTLDTAEGALLGN